MHFNNIYFSGHFSLSSLSVFGMFCSFLVLVYTSSWYCTSQSTKQYTHKNKNIRRLQTNYSKNCNHFHWTLHIEEHNVITLFQKGLYQMGEKQYCNTSPLLIYKTRGLLNKLRFFLNILQSYKQCFFCITIVYPDSWSRFD